MERRTNVPSLTQQEIQGIAEDVYIYGYPLLLMDVARRMHTATARPGAHNAPLNQFAHGRLLPGPVDTDVVQPNADGLNSSAWLDLGKEPVVLTVPRTRRYYVLSFFSGWYEIFGARSARTAATQEEHLGFVAPHWSGTLPAGVTSIVAPTEAVWINGWFAAHGSEDVELVHRVQDQFRLTPLSEWDRAAVPHTVPFRTDVDQTSAPREQIAKLDARTFFTRLSRLMQKNPAQASDAEMLAEFGRIGFVPSGSFAFEALPADSLYGMHRAVAAAQSRIVAADANAGSRKTISNWSLQTHPGSFQKNYIDRAAAARSGTAVALAEDIVGFHTSTDAAGKPLKGAFRYSIRFSGDRLPPVNAFWSLTLYDSRQHLVENSIQRSVIGGRDRLRINPDNSLTIYIQHDWPGAMTDCNWLPAPNDAFSLVLRLYWPRPDVLTGAWLPPAVMRTN